MRLTGTLKSKPIEIDSTIDIFVEWDTAECPCINVSIGKSNPKSMTPTLSRSQMTKAAGAHQKQFQNNS